MLTNGQSLTQRQLLPGADCVGAERLVLELEGAVRISEPLLLAGSSGFSSIELRGATPDSSATLLVDALSNQDTFQSVCLFNRLPTAITVTDGTELSLRSVDLALAPDIASSSMLMLHAENATLSLGNVRVGVTDAAGAQPDRAIRLCNSKLFAVDASFSASAVGLHAMRSDILVYGEGRHTR